MSRNPLHQPHRPQNINPRKVRGGLKLLGASGAFPESWAAQRWMRLIELAAPGDAMVEGLQYATGGQTRRMSIDPGRIAGSVQGRAMRAYDTSLTLATFGHEQWERIIAAMIEAPVYAAKLLAGELPANIEDLFGPLGLRLFPGEATEIVTTCTCQRPPRAWCKHACCLAYLIAERFATDPFLIFTLRGQARDELLERLRQQRTAAGAGAGGALVYVPHVPGVSDRTARPLEECLDQFWEAGPQLEHLDLPVGAPPVSHPLLRRLGPSPFQGEGGGRFPMVGLLATCYEVVSEAVIRQEESGEGGVPVPPPAPDAPGETVQDDETNDGTGQGQEL